MPSELAAFQPPQVIVSNGTVWPYWCDSITAATITPVTLSTTWVNWNLAYSGTLTMGTGGTVLMLPATWTAWNSAYTETAEQRGLRERQQARYQAEQAEWHEARLRASDRAAELLASLLTDEQMASYRDKGWFEVRGSRGGRWRIRNRGQSGNVDLMPEIGDERLATYCAHPPEGLPAGDAHLAQMLALVTDEDAFRRVANLHYRRAA